MLHGPIWAIIQSDGRVLADSTFTDENHVWRIALGWPTVGEVRKEIAKGGRVVKVLIFEADDDG